MKIKTDSPLPRRLILAAVFLLTAFLASTAQAETVPGWPQWRGPLGNGTSPEGKPPTSWSEEENVRFKVEIPGNALASPVIWQDRIFLLTTLATNAEAYAESQKKAAEIFNSGEWPPGVAPVKQKFMVLALSTKDGSVVWEQTASEIVPHESHYIDSSWASGSPVTDGERLYAFFGSNGLYTYDLDGKLLWKKDLGKQRTRNGHGEGSSPALFGDTLVINWDHEDDSFVIALDKRTGKELWRTARPGEVTSWATPLIVEQGGRKQAIVPSTGRSRGYDLKDGSEVWSLGGMTGNVIPTPVTLGNMVYLTSGKRGAILQAVDLAKAQGELEGTPGVAWSHERHTPYVPSVLLYGEQLYFLKGYKNIFTSLNAKTGEVVYTEKRLEGISTVYASPVGAGGAVYIVGRDGAAIVVEHGKEFRVLAKNKLDDNFDASPAISGDDLYLRGRRYLYAISAQ